MTRYRVLPYKQASRSASSLAKELGGKVLRLQGSTYKPRTGDVVINWGNSSQSVSTTLPAWDGLNGFTIVNSFLDICNVANKLTFFNKMQQECPDVVPKHWTSKDDIPADAYPIVCRTILSGHSGAGIVIARVPEDVVDASLYTQYIKKKDEYRVHLGNVAGIARVISVQRKAKRFDAEVVDWEIRNHSNGFVYVRTGVNPPVSVIELGTEAFLASGLDFGAVDVIYNEKKDRSYVLEINSAPGLEGQTVVDYANFFRGG